MAIPENVDLVETSTSFKFQKTLTTKQAPVQNDTAVLVSTTLYENQNLSMIEETTVKDTVDESLQDAQANHDKINNVNKIGIQAEEPVEIPVMSPNILMPIATSNFSDQIKPIQSSERATDLNTIKKKANKIKETLDASAEFKQQEIDVTVSDNSGSTKFLENDIKTTFKKYKETSSIKENVELSPSLTPFAPDQPANPTCFLIFLVIRSGLMNITLGREEICYNFNITYNIPFSKHMKETHFELIFV